MKIVAPVCCGKAAVGYARVYKQGRIAHSIEHGFRCGVCNRHRIPFESGLSAAWAKYQKSMEDLRVQSMAFFGETEAV